MVETKALASVRKVEVEGQWEGDGWIEEGVLDEAADGVSGETCICLNMLSVHFACQVRDRSCFRNG